MSLSRELGHAHRLEVQVTRADGTTMALTALQMAALLDTLKGNSHAAVLRRFILKDEPAGRAPDPSPTTVLPPRTDDDAVWWAVVHPHYPPMGIYVYESEARDRAALCVEGYEAVQVVPV